jgi:hypothetical protein
MLLQQCTLLVMAGHATSTESIDPIEAALVAQGSWAAIRSHAQHATDRGTLVFDARLFGQLRAAGTASVAVAGRFGWGPCGVAAAGDCLAAKIRATGSEQIASHQPAVGGTIVNSSTQDAVQLSLRDQFCSWPTNQRTAGEVGGEYCDSFARLDADRIDA